MREKSAVGANSQFAQTFVPLMSQTHAVIHPTAMERLVSAVLVVLFGTCSVLGRACIVVSCLGHVGFQLQLYYVDRQRHKPHL